VADREELLHVSMGRWNGLKETGTDSAGEAMKKVARVKGKVGELVFRYVQRKEDRRCRGKNYIVRLSITPSKILCLWKGKKAIEIVKKNECGRGAVHQRGKVFRRRRLEKKSPDSTPPLKEKCRQEVLTFL